MKKLLVIALGLLVFSCKDEDNNDDSNGPRPPAPQTLNCLIQKTYPHDTSSFTEGLLIYKGSLYESTGDYGKSKLLKVDLNTGKVIKELKLDDKYFGEGLAILRDTIYQLTYKEHIVFVYSLDFNKIKEFPLELKQGWGLTTDGIHLIAGDGSSDLYFYEPTGFKLVKKLTVTDAGTPSYNLNELEYIDGFIYANQWQLPYIMKIDPNNGQVVGKADLTEIWKRVQAKEPKADVLNGIAYDSSTKKIYITGKRWPELYEVQFNK